MKLFLLIVCTAFIVKTNAQSIPQSCNGSLGDPVINQNFGAGTNPGIPLSQGTNMTYTTNNCPEDGEYTISNSLTGAGNCHTGVWQDVKTDHTGNPNGYMMIVNASYAPSVFFTQTASGLCPNTTYEFSAYVLNLMRLSASTPDVHQPNIVFTITTTSGQTLAIDSTHSIPPTVGPTWGKYGTYFTTPANVTDVIVTMTNIAEGGNGNDLILDDITFRACGPIILSGFGATNGPSVQQLCQGSNKVYTLKANVIANGTVSFQWQANKHNAGWTDTPSPDGQVSDSLRVAFVNADTGTYKYRLGVSNGSDISSVQCRVYSDPLTIHVNPYPIVPPIANQKVCQGYTLTLTASGGASYIWSGPNMPNSTQNPLVITNVTTANMGTYSVTALSDSGCAASPVQTVVTVIPKVVAAISSDVAICAGESTQLMASGGPYYKWTPSTGLDHDNIPNPMASPLVTTKYTVDVSNGGCDDSTRYVTVTVNNNPVAMGGGNKLLFEGQSVMLKATDAGDNITSVFWTPTTALDDPNSLTPIATPTDDITYTLHVVSASCGTAVDNVFVRVFKKITIPNTFSPNSDGINDLWNIEALITYPESSLKVFSRYGQQVYQSTGYSKPWDGKYNGSPVPPGTYYYIIDLKNGKPEISGWVMIVR